ncbi:MAG: crossover junction endodeoxyribonuclease RuvC [Candidatus Yanofskybacteria bacterium RIFCSPHIGHO2_02_FULL_38_22b]|uniref:Crossover junction endodeoxyribonuclease RuvC n=1 Tax=Candidatus Yanofskybacteria bacterium RIFCSPHIGHO2_02_FULL_38_22b TaxID=1802673 RepID=A0A1F8F279_9BACT|nr:MAG: crossover junction endodeoxyribonuclease RuvC [Candidatus Yanofskybacteria bacterium RIFCSPHIGHO2_01_FULL_39_44]OGN06336.1 MAG: crossover junction endodeoxyribonuclease RuvC [Candidatus Yanofskybacteria bacterium RIFCSPHIGHO2_02_FULL_38_22b]OGN19754.1 MAG: crossover junction endodeoxyribonuclease RuvC [Candidatus Yanofskybacteria bacterium RIFCSPLOWO2_01_FULL_39_28]
MIILGIDPGTTRIGIGVIKKDRNKLSCLYYGLIKQPSPALITSEISELIRKYRPEVAAVEKIFFFKNQKTIILVSEMRGVILAALAVNGIPTREFTPLQVKQAVSGYGRSGKHQVELMVRMILGLNQEIKPDDAADGLAIAICCANTIIRE